MKLNTLLETEYERMEEKTIEELHCENEMTEELDILIKLYESWLEDIPKRSSVGPYTNFYTNATDRFFKAPITDISDLSVKDITLFSLKLQKYESIPNFDYTGFFISAVINYHYRETKSKKEYIIFTKNLSKKVAGIGYNNYANVQIIGDVGNRTANHMGGGTLHIQGNALSNCCEHLQNGTVIIDGDIPSYNFCSNMINGNVYVKGSAGDYACQFIRGGTVVIEKNVSDKACLGMHNGTVTIKGNAGKEFATEMENGTIYLGGEYQSLGENIRGGKIKGIEKRI